MIGRLLRTLGAHHVPPHCLVDLSFLGINEAMPLSRFYPHLVCVTYLSSFIFVFLLEPRQGNQDWEERRDIVPSRTEIAPCCVQEIIILVCAALSDDRREKAYVAEYPNATKVVFH